jgi:hypothetical protein
MGSGAATHFIGWDVGGWNCDKNAKSRDAIVILDHDRQIIGTPWRGNLRKTINEAADASTWIAALFALCRATEPSAAKSLVLAIDTPLGFSHEFVALATKLQPVDRLEKSESNAYLYRQTERWLFGQKVEGLKPLSAIKDMIGSQATKGMHVLARFALRVERCGVWADGARLHVIEAYPSACKRSTRLKELRKRYRPLDHDDKQDALTCALIAWLFAMQPDALRGPDDNVPPREGWIWLPRDVVPEQPA